MARTVTTETTETTQIIETDTAWLQALEEKVHAAAGRIRALRDEKGGLERRIQELETQLAARPGGFTEELARQQDENTALRRRIQELEERLATAPSSEDANRWVEERQEIRGRVARLVEHLETLEEL